MRLTALVAVALGLFVATGSVLLISRSVEIEPAPAQAYVEPEIQIDLTPVVVAARPLEHGDTLSMSALKVVDWPTESLPEGAFSAFDQIFVGQERPHRILRRIERGEAVLEAKLSGFSGRATISTNLTPGMRAVSIRVNDVSGVAGFLLPGDRVDVMLTRKVQTDLVTGLILQNMSVIGVDQITDQTADQPVVARTVTLEADPRAAQKLALAMQVGTLSLSLRQAGETEIAPAEEIDVRDLSLGAKKRVPAEAAPKPEVVVKEVVKEKVVFRDPPKPERPPTVRIRRGAEVTTEPMIGSEAGRSE